MSNANCNDCKFAEWPRHKLHKCGEECNGCMFCEGGLALCTVCGGGEASLPTDCPAEPMTRIMADAVQGGLIDYDRKIGWHCIGSNASQKGR